MEDDIKRDLYEIIYEAVNSAGSAKIQWRSLKNIVITLQIP
jgi:hypothetical protein